MERDIDRREFMRRATLSSVGAGIAMTILEFPPRWGNGWAID